jgi:Flp pilus assembly pilin Flp
MIAPNVACSRVPRFEIVSDQRGLSTVEYVIILVLIAAAAVGTWSAFGATIKEMISSSNTTIANMDGTSTSNGNGQGQSSSNGQSNNTTPSGTHGRLPNSKQ